MSVVEFFSQPVWHRLSLTLVHFLWQGLAVAVIAYGAVRLLRLRRGNPRYAAYLLALAVMAVAPAVTFVSLHAPATATPFTLEPTPAVDSAMPILHAAPATGVPQLSEDALPVGSTYKPPLRATFGSVLQALLPWVLVVWMSGVLILSVRLLLGFLGVRRWRRNLEPLPDDLKVRVGTLAERLGLPGFFRVFVSHRAMEAVALGYMRPMVLLPAALLTQMQPEMVEAVIAHELAHIRRLDLWVNLAQRVVETLLFYHPAVWWLSSRLRSERELCCDEMAVKATGERLVYASALEHAGRASLSAGQPALALGFGPGRQSTLGRVRHILGLPPAPASSPYWLAGVVAFLVLAILVMRAASSPTARAEVRDEVSQESKNQAEVAGRVLAKDTGQPIEGARVRVGVPALNMRLARSDAKQITQDNGVKSDIYETTTDAAGRFEKVVTTEPGRDTASVDVLTPGYGSAAGAGATDNPQLAHLSLTGPSAATASNLTISLPRAIYVAGVVKDERGKPIAGVRIQGPVLGGAMGKYLLQAQTDEQGRFEIFDLPAQIGPDLERAGLFVDSATPLAGVPWSMWGRWAMSDLYRMTPEKRATLEVTMRRTVKITGVLLDAESRPVSGATVEAHHGHNVPVVSHATTEADGRFELTGLGSAASYELRAGALDLQQRAVQPVRITDHDEDVTLRMQRVELKTPLQSVTLFGMQLADFTPELRELYDLGRGGVLVLDPGPNHQRLGLGTLRRGCCILRVERVPVFSLRNMVAEMLQHLAQTADRREGILVRYADRFGTETESLKLAPADIAELRQLAEKLGVTVPRGN
jgi:beta-lactamase regulating signal transducer with metallopeptidase domain/5-hydroxyisourate hydrolase-like protein (transthyretin family)